MNQLIHHQSNRRLSRAVVHNQTVYLSGVTATDRSNDVAGQAQEILDKISSLLELAGSDRHHVLSAQIYLRDIGRDLAAFNEIWDAWIKDHIPPSRAAIQASMGSPDVLVEIMVIACTR
ncbi:MAG: RidA family protein [Pigmentiphaga sp.]|uniref:RidA family protein n=1 Tax=Pigmentiphaga sp. TaxID=1977564 RepID=UPI003B54DCA8